MTRIVNDVDYNCKKNRACDAVFMYPGQGSQYYGMAKTLFERNSIFKEWMENLDAIVVEITGNSVIQELYHSGKTISHPFTRTLFTHPAIFMVEYSLTKVLYEKGIRPSALVGSSLGEFTCLSVAGAVAPEEMLEFIVRQAMIFEEKCAPGGMIAILDNYQLFCNTPLLCRNAELVSVNSDNHFVVSGNIEGINVIEHFLQENKVTYLRLPVSFGFHSENLAPAYDEFIRYARKLHISRSTLPIYSSQRMGILENAYPELLWNIVRENINFSKILKCLDINRFKVFVDVGPSGTLANIAKAVMKRTEGIYGIINQFHAEQKIMEEFKEIFFNDLMF